MSPDNNKTQNYINLFDSDAIALHLKLLGDRKNYSIFGGKPEWSEKAQKYIIQKDSPNKATEWILKDKLIDVLNEYYNKQWTVWVSLNDKETGDDTTEGVKAISVFWFDFDAPRANKAEPATDEEREKAFEEAKKFKEWMQKTFGIIGFIACSGNGYHLFYPIESYPLLGKNFRKEVNEKQRTLFKKLRETSNIDFDTTTDIRRVTQPIGGLNYKIPDKPLKTYWIDTPTDENIENAREKNAVFLEAVLNTKIEQPKTVIVTGSHPKFEELLEKDAKLRDLYAGNWQKYNFKSERSGAEESFVTKLCQAGFTDDKISEVMKGCKIGKWQEKGKSYHNATIKKGREFAVQHKKEGKDNNILSEIENTIEDTKKPKYRGTINFNPDLGIFFTVPWEIPSYIIKDEKGKIEKVYTPQCKPILHNLREGFAQPTDEDKLSRIKKCLHSQPQQIIEVISQFSEAIEGVPLYLSSKQRVQMLEAYLTLLKTGKNPCKLISGDLVTHLYSKHMYYFKFEKDIEHYVVGCWAIGTYLFPMFPVFPYLLFIGEKGTNKSGNLTFLDSVCWNPTSKLSLPNEAPLFRLMHQAKPTQLIDEVHRQLNDPIRGPVLKALLETGHEKGGRVPRCSERDNNKIEFFDVFCPKALASRESLELEEKAITIITTKVQDKKYAIARKNLETDLELENIQFGLFNFAITNWERIYTAYQKIEPTPKLSGRYFMLWAPVLAICKTAYPDKYDEMVEYAEEVIMGVQKKSYEIELTVLSWLATRLTDIKNNGSAILLKEVKDALNLKWQPTYSALRNLGVIKLDRDTKNGKKYYLHVDRIEKLAEERGIITEETETVEDEDNDVVSEEEIKKSIDELGFDEIKKIKKLEKEMLGVCDICKSPRKPLIYGIEGKYGDIKKAFCDECMKKITHGGAQ